MNCDRIAAEFVVERYVSGTLPTSEVQAFEEHMLTCERCQREVVVATGIREEFRGDGGDGVLVANPPKARERRTPRFAVAATILIAALGAAWWLMAGRTGDDSTQRVMVMPVQRLAADSVDIGDVEALYGRVVGELFEVGSIRRLTPPDPDYVTRQAGLLPDLAREAGADFLLESAISRIGDSLSLNLQLREAKSWRIAWSGTYRAPADSTDVLYTRADEIRETLVEQGGIRVSSEQRRRLVRADGIDPRARRLYDEGFYLLRFGDPSGIARAIEALTQAIEIEPDFAEAHSMLATGYITAMYTIGLPTTEAYPAATEAARAAIELDESVSDAHGALGWSLFLHEWDWDGALRELERGYELEPHNELASFFYSFVLAMMGRHDEAIRIAESRAEADPFSVPTVNHVGTVHSYARNYEQSIAGYERALEIQPAWHFAYQRLPLAYSELGRHEEAIEVARAGVAQDSVYRAQLAMALAMAGRVDEAREIADTLLAETYRGEYPFLTVLAGLFGLVGDPDQAFELLERAVVDRDRSLPTIGEASEFDPLRADPRFQAVKERLGFPAE